MSKSIAVGIMLFVLGVAVGRISVLAAQPTTASANVTPVVVSSAPSQAANPGGVLHGRIAEVIQVPQYTYLRFESGEWAAVTSAPSLSVGQEVDVTLQNEMQNFTSTSLGRTFARIWFGSLGAAEPSSAPTVAPLAPPVAPPVPQVAAALQAVEASAAVTMRVVDVFSERAVLNGQRVKVKATVDRVNVVQGLRYVHVKDGTGSADDKTNDLLCISASDVPAGQVVTLAGVVVVDKNVGMGPVPVVLDQATLVP